MKAVFPILFLFLFSCSPYPEDAPLNLLTLTKTELNDTLVANLSVVGSGFNYMPSQAKKSDRAITSFEIACEELNKLYPDYTSRIKCWTEYKGYYVFSVGFNDPQTDCMFWHILYVKKGGNEFWYFWPAT